MKTRFLSILSAFALAVCSVAQPFVKNTVTTNEVVSGVLTPTHNLVTVKTNFTVTGTQNVQNLQASTLTITNDWNAIGATNMLMANMRNSTNTSLSIGVSNVYATGEASWPTGHVAYLFATNANYGSANVTNLYTLLTNSPILATDGNGKLISTNAVIGNAATATLATNAINATNLYGTISASQLTSGTNNTASIGAAEFVAGRFVATNASQTSLFGDIDVSGGDVIIRRTANPYVDFYDGALPGTLRAEIFATSDGVDGGTLNLGVRSSAGTMTYPVVLLKSGFLGIGTNNPDAHMTIGNTAPSANQVMLDIKARGTNVVEWDEDGDQVNQGTLSIGTTLHASPLTVKSKLVAGSIWGGVRILEASSDSQYWDIGAIQSYSAPDLLFSANGTGKIVFDHDGQVGVGTVDAQAMLHVTNVVAKQAAVFRVDTTAGTNTFLVSSNGTTYFGGASNHVAHSLVASNFTLSMPAWKDSLHSPTVLSKGGTATERQLLKPGSLITVEAWKQGSFGDGEAQFNHDLAKTNANFPDLYVVPHVHLSCTNLPTDKSNTTWAVLYNWTSINGHFTNSVDGAITNTWTLEAFKHHIGGFTPITNNAANGTISSILSFRIYRLDGGDGDLDDAEGVVRLHDFDIHYPVNRLGSTEAATY